MSLASVVSTAIRRLWPSPETRLLPPLNVRRSLRSDARAVAGLLSYERGEVSGEELSDAVRAAWAPATGEATCAWVALLGGRVVGVAIATLADDRLELCELVVDPGCCGLGIGTRLLAAVREYSRQRGAVCSIVVRSTDVAGLRWLCRRGFEPLVLPSSRGRRGVVLDDVFEGCDAYVFVEAGSVVTARIAE